MEASTDIEKGNKGNRSVDPLVDFDSPILPEGCIFRVPEVIRRQNKEAYEPKIVSIGPIHRGREQFQLVEEVKKRYLACFLQRLKIPLEKLREFAKEMEQRARDSYADTFKQLDQTDFVNMLILDGCYLVELFLKGSLEDLQGEDDPTNFNASFMFEYLYHDLLLLENQLPWFVLKFFYEKSETGDTKRKDLCEVVIDFFKPLVAAATDDSSILSYPQHRVEIFHILDLIRTALIEGEHEDQSSLPPISHLPKRIPTAATLLNAGVKFKKGRSRCILDIKFKNGVFTIPPVTIDEKTNTLFRNFIAYEQLFHGCKYKITSYVVLMSNLINTSEDVDLLCEKGIVVNWLTPGEVSKLFNELYKDTTINEFKYRRLCHAVEQYNKSLCGQWKKKYICRLKIDYCYTPWATLSVFAAFVLLVLTFLQTIYTILQFDPHPAPESG